MPRPPIFDHPMSPAERQKRRRLKLAGGPITRLRREVQRALDAGMPPAEVAAVALQVSEGAQIPAGGPARADGHAKRDIEVTKGRQAAS